MAQGCSGKIDLRFKMVVAKVVCRHSSMRALEVRKLYRTNLLFQKLTKTQYAFSESRDEREGAFNAQNDHLTKNGIFKIWIYATRFLHL